MPDPVDPASLAGDALTQWYARSPDEIDQVRQKAFAERYDDFFYRPIAANPDPGFDRPLPPGAADVDPGFSRNIDLSKGDPDPGFTWVQVGNNRWRSTPVSTVDNDVTSSPENIQQIAFPQQATSTPGAVASCPSCHGRVPPLLPFPLPFLPGGPLARGSLSLPSGGRSPKRNFPQCEVQYDNDTEICGGLPKADARARCRASASERQAYCLSHDGQVGWPYLIRN